RAGTRRLLGSATTLRAGTRTGLGPGTRATATATAATTRGSGTRTRSGTSGRAALESCLRSIGSLAARGLGLLRLLVRHRHRRARLSAATRSTRTARAATARGGGTRTGLGARTRWSGNRRLPGAISGLAFRRPVRSPGRLRPVGRLTAAPGGATLRYP
ncbi:hypothetical protein ACWEPC_59385, partial [Nonomuraea sp. NPDC004297]